VRLSADELAAALYEDDQLCPGDLIKDENVWGFAAVAIVQDGLNAIQHHRDEILTAEAQGRPAHPVWLAVKTLQPSDDLRPQHTAPRAHWPRAGFEPATYCLGAIRRLTL
jgi:hypothetical protein